MQDNTKFTMEKALEISINHIDGHFSNDWLISDHYLQESDSRRLKTKDSRLREFYPSDFHNYIEVCVCVNGRFAIDIHEATYEIGEGEACIIFPGFNHSELCIKGVDHMVIWMSFSQNKIRLHLSGNLNNEFFTKDVRTFAADHEFTNIINSINMEKNNKYIFSNMLFKLYILQILIIALKKISIDTSVSPDSEMFKKKIAEEVKEFIENNGFRYLHLRDISQGLFISAGYLNNIFKSVTGTTIMQYMENRRVARAMYLLKYTNESISSISMQLGYYDQYHFSKSFKKATGSSPSGYRKTPGDKCV